MKIIYKSIEDLKLYENNPRNNDEAVEMVARSIKLFGFKVPLVIDRNSEVICGHTRYKASKMLKIKEIPCIIADDLNEEQIRAFRIADNKVSEFSRWDYDKLRDELQNIDNSLLDFDYNMDLDITDDDFIMDVKKQKNNEEKKYVCPHCGEEF